MQGAGGMRFHSPACVALLRELCDEHGLLLVLDEIATGFGRTGAMFACEHAGVSPDVMCVGKALTGGYMTLAATLCTAEVADGGLGGRGRRADARPDVHGQPARVRGRARVARAARRRRLARAGRGDRSAGSARASRAARELDGVADVRVLGAIGVIELEQPVDIAAATAAARRARRVAAAVPGPDLRDAAVCHRRGRPGARCAAGDGWRRCAPADRQHARRAATPVDASGAALTQRRQGSRAPADASCSGAARQLAERLHLDLAELLDRGAVGALHRPRRSGQRFSTTAAHLAGRASARPRA